ncbi:conjugative transposon protein TraM [Dyadobacter sp. CY323]|uniref:conjugative transposon protein TraM n=1 Tax=Dyadobacter sp. CY323 TaxID=2907302 RepID=UPI001F41D75F|nr:conjugative transposon protein TraM [Dyadobacter sp. CY323]MCE6989529.1 conjugative transposon protein TraM [Dyadobacter sp. CY323]
MQKTAYTRKFLQQRKFYTFLPLLVLPFLTLFFWVLISRNKGSVAAGKDHKGLILSLPEAFFKDDKDFDKLSYYQKAAADSARLRDLIEKDPYYQDTLLASKSGPLGVPLKDLNGPGKKRKTIGGASDADSTKDPDQQVHNKLRELDKVLSQTSQPKFDDENRARAESDKKTLSPEMARLEQMMAGIEMEEPVEEEDPEMTELNGMLDKIMQIQNPALAEEKLRGQSMANEKQVFPVLAASERVNYTLLASGSSDSLNAPNTALLATNGFYALNDNEAAVTTHNAIEAVIDQDQTLVTGATIKLRLATDVFIAGNRVVAGSSLYGKVSLNQERLRINVEAVKSGSSLFPVSLTVYDLDGIEGIYIPGALSRDIGKQSSDRMIQSFNVPIIDQSVGARAASAGIEVAKTFLGRRAKLIQVSVKAGYKVLLKDANAKSL